MGLFGGGDSSSSTTNVSTQSDVGVNNAQIGGPMQTVNAQNSTGIIQLTDLGATNQALAALLEGVHVIADSAKKQNETSAGVYSGAISSISGMARENAQSLADIKGSDTVQQRYMIIGVVVLVAVAAIAVVKGR